MSVPRLTFLYPPRLLQRRLFSTTCRRLAEPTRHGTAVDPSAPHGKLRPATPATPSPPSNDDPKQSSGTISSSPSSSSTISPSSAGPPPAKSPPIEGPGLPNTTGPAEPAEPSKPINLPEPAPWPTVEVPPSTSPPLHHFDTYTLVQRLSANSTFTPTQSIALISSLRHLLLHHLSLASAQYISRSDVSNQSYLFTTACSELRQKVSTQRRADLDQLRLERNRIQSEFDELNQRFMVELLDMRNEISDMFNERKMAGRAEMRGMENKIQELNYKITIMLGSEVRSEIEKLRWITTRRGLLAIFALAAVVFTCLRMNGTKKSPKDNKASKKKKPSEGEFSDDDENVHPKLPRPSAGHLQLQ